MAAKKKTKTTIGTPVMVAPGVAEVTFLIENLHGGVNPVFAEQKQPHTDEEAADGLAAVAARIAGPAGRAIQTAADRRRFANRKAGWPEH